MSEPGELRVFVNGTALHVPHDARILDAVRALDPAVAAAAEAGERAVTDSRGLPVALDAAVTGGTVLRVGSVRKKGPTPGEPDPEPW